MLEANNASDSESTGISLESESYSNDLIRNESSHNDGEGIYIGIEAAAGSGMLLEGNRTDNNKGYGLYVSKPSHVIKGNSANDNGSWGIYAGEPSNGRTNVDAGGNRGQGNLGPLDPITLLPQQCHLVECTGGPPLGGDNVAPDTQLTERPPNPSTDDVAIFRFDGSDNISDVTFQCSVTTAEAFAPCDSPAVYEGLEPGLHQFQVRAVDASGNVDSTPATYSWTIGAQPAGQAPETTIEAAPDPMTVRSDAASSSSRPSATRPSSAGSTARPSGRARGPACRACSSARAASWPTAASRSARTPSRCARSTSTATSISRPPRGRGGSGRRRCRPRPPAASSSPTASSSPRT